MRSIIVVCVLAAVALVSADTVLYPRGCRYINGRCVEECPVGTHAYALGCGYLTPEPTCREPNPVQEKHQLCDFSDCYCDAPMVRDETTNECVQLADCPPPTKELHQPHDPSATATAEASAPA